MLKRSIFTSMLIALTLLPAPALARTSVSVDPYFGSDGSVSGSFGPRYGETSFVSLTPQPDGTVLAARRNGSEGPGLLRRYHPSGELDTSYAPQWVPQQVEAVEAGGKTLKVIERSLIRLNPDGTPDPTFGVKPYGADRISDAVDFRIEQIEPLPSGKILVGGTVIVHIPEDYDSPGGTLYEQVALARFDHEGRLDPGFGAGGIVKLDTDLSLAGKGLIGLAARPGEHVTVIVLDSLLSPSGKAVNGSGSVVVGLAPNGQLDPSYSGDGTVRLEDAIEVFQPLPDGELMVAGDRWGPKPAPYAAHESDVFLNRYAADGEPDSGFGGGDGSVTVNLEGVDLAHSALWEDDGSVVLGGAATEIDSSNCMRFYRFCRETPFLVRFTPSGSLDTAFGRGGILRLDALSAPYASAWGGNGVLVLAARPGGGTLAAGGSGISAFLTALSPSGALDPSFGSGGIVTETDPSPSRSAGHSAAIDSRGRILVAGRTDADIVGGPEDAVFRYAPNGALDRSFGVGSGYARVPGDGRNRIAVAWDNSSFVLSDRWVTRLTAGGRIDTSFGEEGTAELPGSVYIRRNGRQQRLPLHRNSMKVLPNGDLLVAGTAGSSDSRVVVVRLQPNGALDPSFGRQGIAVLRFKRNRVNVANQMAVQPNGRIVLAGYVQGPGSEVKAEVFALMRLLPNGAPDRSFGDRGLATVRVGRRSLASALAIQRNGAIVVAGRARVGSAVRELMLRYTRRGQLDRRFARGGISSSSVPLKPGGFSARPEQVLLLGDRILVLRDDPRRQLVAYTRRGRLDGSFVVAPDTEAENRSIAAPFGAIQSGSLILGWQIFEIHSSFKLQRLRIG